MRNWGVALLASTMLIMAGCGSGSSSGGGSSGGTPYNPYGYSGVMPGVTSPIGIGVYPSQYPSNPGMNFSIQMIGDAATAAYYGNNFAYYVGAVGMTGSFTVSYGSYVGGCVLPAGNYSFQTTSQGYASGGSIQGSMQAQGSGTGGSLMMVFQSTVLWNQNSRISTKMYITSMNGMACGSDPGFTLN